MSESPRDAAMRGLVLRLCLAADCNDEVSRLDGNDLRELNEWMEDKPATGIPSLIRGLLEAEAAERYFEDLP